MMTTATMISAGKHAAANSSIGRTLEIAERPSPYAPRRLCTNRLRVAYPRPSRSPSYGR